MKGITRNRLPVLVVPVLLTICLSGCVTGTALEEAKDHVYYKPQAAEDPYKPLEVERVEKGKPGLYALLPLTVVADVALIPVYVGWIIAVNVGLMEP